MNHATDPGQLVRDIEKFAQARILILGDIMVDEYLTGDAERISPEAPVPVIRIESEKRLVGGAGNVARNITSLGGKAMLVGLRGADAAGAAMEESLKAEAINYSLLTLDNRPTTIKTRILARQQQVLRFDKEDTGPLTKAENLAILRLAADYLAESDVLILSDYGKGLMSESIINGVHECIRGTGKNIPILVDPKPQNIHLYKGISLLTPNAKETSEATHLPVKTPQDIVRAGKSLMNILGCKHLVTTLGSRGMAVFETEESIRHIPTVAQQVFDVTGAGDTVIATIALGLAAGLELVPACLLANYAAGIVVGQVGAATTSPDQLRAAIASTPQPEAAQWA